MKKVLSLFVCIILLFVLVACEYTKAITYTVTFVVDGNIESAQSVEKGELLEKPQNPEKTGYTFVGWYVDDELWSFNGYTVNKNMELVAKFNVNKYTLTCLYSKNGDIYKQEEYAYGEALPKGEEVDCKSFGLANKELDKWLNIDDVTFTTMPDHDLVVYPVWKDNNPDDGAPQGITIKVMTYKVTVNNEIKLTYEISPASCQDDNVKITLNNDLATYEKQGNNTIVLKVGAETGTVKVTVETSNGMRANKTIKIEAEDLPTYPDLSGYTIKIAQAECYLGEIDVNLTEATKDTYGYYDELDRYARIQAWKEIEKNYNCAIKVVSYPSDAPWGPARWSYILSQAQNESPDYDFYVVPDGIIPSLVKGNAILNLIDLYAEYGNNYLSYMKIQSTTHKGKLYGINDSEENVYNILGYNVGLLEKIQKIDSTIVSPAKMYLNDNWNYNAFKEYCIKVQAALNKISTGTDKYYALSGYGTYYWIGMVNAGGVKVLDATQLKVNLTGTTETLAAQTLRELYAAGCMDPAQQVDGGVVTWNDGKALFNTGDLWFVNNSYRWCKDLWGEETRYGYVPFPTLPDSNHVFVGTVPNDNRTMVMAAGREWAYAGFGEECTAKNIYRAYIDYLLKAKSIYTNDENYSEEKEVLYRANRLFGDEDSVKAYVKVILGTKQQDGTYIGGIKEYGFFDPFVTNTNPVAGNYGSGGTLPGSVIAFIKGGEGQWIDAVGSYQSTINKELVDVYG